MIVTEILMHMKRLHRYWISAILLIASMTSNAANGIIETKTYELCPGGSITLGIRQITVWSDTIMYDTLLVADPAQDSIYQYVVTVYPPFAKSESNRICIGDSIKWQDTVLYTAGVYERIYQSKHGCDSIYRFTLETYRPDTIDTTVVICPSTSFTWHGITAGMSGDYERMDTRPNGDLLYCRLHLTVKPLVHEEVLFTLCDDESVSFHGKTYVNA